MKGNRSTKTPKRKTESVSTSSDSSYDQDSTSNSSSENHDNSNQHNTVNSNSHKEIASTSTKKPGPQTTKSSKIKKSKPHNKSSESSSNKSHPNHKKHSKTHRSKPENISNESTNHQNHQSKPEPNNQNQSNASNNQQTEHPQVPPTSPPNEESSSRKVDRYGWYIKPKAVSKYDQKLTTAESAKEMSRSLKWKNMLDHWDQWMPKRYSKVASRLRKGIPDCIRSQAWMKILHSDLIRSQFTTPMDELLQRPPHVTYSTIDDDLNRTFPQVGYFSHNNFIESLRRVLRCYSQIDTELGYTQGMNFIAGMFLSYMDEENAFYCFASVFQSPKIYHRGYVIDQFPRLIAANNMLTKLMKKKCPKALRNIEKEGIEIKMFSTRWFITAFQAYNWEAEFQMRIFERFLFYGTRGLLSFALLIVLIHQDIIEKSPIEIILKYLQHPDESERMVNWHKILEKWDDSLLSRKNYINLVKSVGENPEPL
ncbi:TBC domain containing protein [Histomonas meleagridis]|uniref:TBC domain containing protein n=1 Tax=Histomonas meleagridis TaxID=135588 RepID=UPI00355AA8E4|nr:TBC domain containing protein [Histomonas meleagridis]KAH0797981.1 TBC domain containing protein [Histomonas meleagridis]